jgi:glycosyltransferase involved in cell wall biosynthesis
MTSSQAAESPHVAIVIPIYNEEGILHSAVVDLRERLSPLGFSYEIILAENGSTDGTVELARTLTQKYPEVRFITAGEPDYGKALRTMTEGGPNLSVRKPRPMRARPACPEPSQDTQW